MENKEHQKEFLTSPELQSFLGCSRSWIYQLIDERKLTRYKVNKRIYFKRSEILNLFQASE